MLFRVRQTFINKKNLTLNDRQNNLTKIYSSIVYTTFSTIKQEILYTVKKELDIVNFIPYENFLYDIFNN